MRELKVGLSWNLPRTCGHVAQVKNGLIETIGTSCGVCGLSGRVDTIKNDSYFCPFWKMGNAAGPKAYSGWLSVSYRSQHRLTESRCNKRITGLKESDFRYEFKAPAPAWATTSRSFAHLSSNRVIIIAISSKVRRRTF